jgi:AcrR family transcriptional regulator
MTGRAGRRTGESGTSEAIVEAARAQFAEHGYRGATIRAIAAKAGVDPALVHHFYGTKEELFAAAMQLGIVPSQVIGAALEAGRGTPAIGEHIIRTALGLWESDGLKDTFLGLFRSAATSESAAVMLREFLAESILGTIARVTQVSGSPAEVQYRVALVASQMIGLAITRLVLKLPAIADASIDELAASIGPTLERYLSGEIVLPDQF